uniref:CS domain-containing protein n=2 Tax=Emiliania huxleyi TaxID=2903 RepID=A0A7S3RX16_EMIHU|mmetsp:Transcript_31985/g.95136  ORF Transcript_31985/g.95136 Transcript_31985/m.95136 type:complete len:840 (+) Transcript_31985:49-2568(+)
MVLSPSYTWSETKGGLTVIAQCTGASVSTTDVFSSPHYVSLNSAPYFLELDLHGEVLPDESVATIAHGKVTLRLQKAGSGLWGRLVVDMPRTERLKRRAASRASAEEAAAAQAERKKSKSWNESRFTLGQQMDQDRMARVEIERAKAAEKEAEAAKLRDWQNSVGTSPTSVTAQPHSEIAETDEPPALVNGGIAPSSAHPGQAQPSLASAETSPPRPSRPPRQPPLQPRSIPRLSPPPPPRRTGTVSIKFTPKLLPAPARTKGAAADRELPPDPLAAPQLAGTVAPDAADISQRDPAWLKARGDRHYTLRDWASAESAYSHVLSQFGKSIMGQAIDCVVACYSNRSVCRIRRGEMLAAAADASEALNIVCKARCVTEFPKPEEALQRARMRLYARRATAYAAAGVLHRATADLHSALALVGATEGMTADPGAVSDRSVLTMDLHAAQEREEAAAKLRQEAAALVAHCANSGEERTAEGQLELTRARELLNECLGLQPLDAATLAQRATCLVLLYEPSAAAADATAGLAELDAEAARDGVERSMMSGLFPPSPLPDEVRAALVCRSDQAERVRFALLESRGAARAALSQLQEAASDLRAALKLRPAHPSVLASLDEIARRAVAEGVDLQHLPLAPPASPEPAIAPAAQPQGKEAAVVEARAEATESGSTGEPAASSSAKEPKVVSAGVPPPVGTRSAALLKGDADGAVRNGKLEQALQLYGAALQADAAAEWLQGTATGGLLFRCQCLANRAACHLRLSDYNACVDDATAALTALDAIADSMAAAAPLRLKLLARRGMALSRLTRHMEARDDYRRAVALAPDDAQLRHDLSAIEKACETA